VRDPTAGSFDDRGRDVAHTAPVVVVDEPQEARLEQRRADFEPCDSDEEDEERERAERFEHARSLSLVVAMRVNLLHHPPVHAIPLVDLPLG